jgi:hypothetical protein
MAQKYKFGDGKGPVPAHQHPNGGGWVADTAKVADTSYVGPDAWVYGDAQVSVPLGYPVTLGFPIIIPIALIFQRYLSALNP